VISVDIEKGITFLMWHAFAWELPRLCREDPTYAAELVKGVVSSCIAPALAEHTPANANDEAAYGSFLRSWPRSAAITRDTLYRQACAETIAWLAISETKRDVRRLAEKLFIYRHEVLEGEFLARLLAQFTTPPPAPEVATAVVSARPGKPVITGLDIQYQWLLEDAENLQRSIAHAQGKRPHSPYRPFAPRFTRLVATNGEGLGGQNVSFHRA